MLIAHEAPLSIIKEVVNKTDYCYALVHLFETNTKYYDHFKAAVENNREVLLDNSIFELKKAFNAAKFAGWIEKLKPTYYIVPDELECGYNTRYNFEHWLKAYNNLPGLKIGAVQGKTYQEIVDCYKFMADNADYIALSFDFSYYETTGHGKSKLERLSSGRKQLVSRLIEDGVWCHDKPHHLLGCSLVSEFSFYTKHNVSSIRSLDTSNPVMHGILGNRYIEGLGLNYKSSQLLADNINNELTPKQIKDIIFNIVEFRNIAHRF